MPQQESIVSHTYEWRKINVANFQEKVPPVIECKSVIFILELPCCTLLFKIMCSCYYVHLKIIVCSPIYLFNRLENLWQFFFHISLIKYRTLLLFLDERTSTHGISPDLATVTSYPSTAAPFSVALRRSRGTKKDVVSKAPHDGNRDIAPVIGEAAAF